MIHLDAGGKTRKIDAVYIRKSVTCLFLVWHRSIYSIKKNNIYEMVKAIMCYSLSWLLMFIFSFIYFYKRIWTAPIDIIRGLFNGIKFTRSPFYADIKPFK